MPWPETSPPCPVAPSWRWRRDPLAVPRGLFSEFEERRAALCALFDEFVAARAEAGAHERAQRPWRDSSIAMYRAAWGPFAQYCADRRLELANVTSADLEGFLAQRSVRRPMRDRPTRTAQLDGRYAYRLLSLIDKLAAFDAAQRPGTPANAAAQRADPARIQERELPRS